MKRVRKDKISALSAYKKVILNELHALSSVIANRSGLANTLGQSFGGRRDIYKECGYPLILTYQDYKNRYDRQDFAYRIIWAPVLATWRIPPEIKDDDTPEISSPFEKAWADLVKAKKIFIYLARVDALAGLGQYAVLLLGVSKKKQLMYLRPYSEVNATIESWDTHINSARYGLPSTYKLKTGMQENKGTIDKVVDFSKVIHVAEGTLENDVYGAPSLKNIYNRLQDVETILAGSTEMFWQGAFPGMSFEMDAEADPDTQTLADIDDQIVTYIHHLRRTLRLQGIKTNQLKPQVASPTAHLTAQLKLISGAKGIPMRILTGSERGELASTQDEKNWNSRVDERRATHAESNILRPFIDRLVSFGVLPTPKNNTYEVIWHDITATSEEDEARIIKLRMEALALYSNAIGARDIYPINSFLKKELKLSASEVRDIVKEYEKKIKEVEKNNIEEKENNVEEGSDENAQTDREQE